MLTKIRDRDHGPDPKEASKEQRRIRRASRLFCCPESDFNGHLGLIQGLENKQESAIQLYAASRRRVRTRIQKALHSAKKESTVIEDVMAAIVYVFDDTDASQQHTLQASLLSRLLSFLSFPPLAPSIALARWNSG
ncbi:hypothetical protein AAE478_002745 [Parahypoxylon ruwenzoriense]